MIKNPYRVSRLHKEKGGWGKVEGPAAMDPVGPHLHFASFYLQGVNSSAPPQSLYHDCDNDDDGYCGGGDDNDVTLFESNLLPASSTKTLTGLFISFEEARMLWAALRPAIPPPTTITSYFFLALFDSII